MWLEGEAKKAGFVLKKGSELLQCVVNKHIAELDKDFFIFVVNYGNFGYIFCIILNIINTILGE